MGKVSVIIPARNEPFLPQTVEDILKKATGDIEVIVILDGYWPDPPLADHPNLVIIHTGTARGMRVGINSAARIATGDYLMKCDAHCMFAEGFDVALQKGHKEDWLAVPSRYSLDPKEWKWARNRPVEYLYITFPYVPDNLYGDGLHGKKWTGETMGKKGFYKLEDERKDFKRDDIITFQGSCWFMHKKHFINIGCMDESYDNIHQEAQELGFKTWLSGGRCIRNKNTWYAHWHKNSGTRGYRLSKRSMRETQERSTKFWMDDQWPLAKRKMKWLIKKFMPMPGWPEDWEEQKLQYETTHA